MNRLSLIIILTILFPQFQLNRLSDHQIESGLPSNGIIDIRQYSSDIFYLGTGYGLSQIQTINDSLIFNSIIINEFPEGGNPSLIIKDDIIAVSGVSSVYVSATNSNEPKGNGIAYSFDGGSTWNVIDQSTDDIPESGLYHQIYWGNQLITALSVTTDINNVSYDLTILGEYVYAASWAGGLRRFKATSTDSEWETIPLPMDTQNELICNEINTDEYELNPKDPKDGGNHNHKGFSVFVDSNDTIWVGTANGINKGYIDSNCLQSGQFSSNNISWTNHYTFSDDGISGNWIIGFEEQVLDELSTRLWAITWSTEDFETNALSYTDDGGDTWEVVNYFMEKDIKIYNVYSKGELVFATSEVGLFMSMNGIHWERFSNWIDSKNGEIVLDESAYSVIQNSNDNSIWIGTGDGMVTTPDLGLSCTVYRFWNQDPSPENSKSFSAYPNPFYVNEQWMYQGDGHVRFIFDNETAQSSEINLYDFSMDHVAKISQAIQIELETEMIWNGRNDYGDIVANGVYFCRLYLDGNYYWTKLVVVN